MQQRMKTHQLTDKETDSLLLNCMTGTLATSILTVHPYAVRYIMFFGTMLFIFTVCRSDRKSAT